MSAIATTYVRPFLSAQAGRPRQLPAWSEASRQLLLAVEFRSRDGRSWNAIGGGTSVAAAIEWARESCPDGTTWYAVSWNDLYGD